MSEVVIATSTSCNYLHTCCMGRSWHFKISFTHRSEVYLVTVDYFFLIFAVKYNFSATFCTTTGCTE